jgi:tetratricopeptide (TPR) repeat protein
MALGVASVTTFLALKTLRLLRTTSANFYLFDLKSSGQLRKAGWVFLVFALLWIGLTAHSGWVRYHEYAGERAFQNIAIPDELALANTKPDSWLSPNDREQVLAGQTHLRAANSFGLFANSEALPKLAWFEYLAGNTEQAVQLLETAAAKQHGQARALSLYYRGAILNRLGRYEQARTSLDQALTERPDLILAREERGEALWQLGRKQEAVAAWSDAVQRNERLVIANNQLAGAAASIGKSEIAKVYETQADQFTPADPLFHWMIGMRLENLGMNALAEKHFQQAIQLDPEFQVHRRKGSY